MKTLEKPTSSEYSPTPPPRFDGGTTPKTLREELKSDVFPPRVAENLGKISTTEFILDKLDSELGDGITETNPANTPEKQLLRDLGGRPDYQKSKRLNRYGATALEEKPERTSQVRKALKKDMEFNPDSFARNVAEAAANGIKSGSSEKL